MILARYLAEEVLGATLLVGAALLVLFAFFDLIHELGDLGRGEYQLLQLLAYVLLSLPGHVYELFPISVSIGALYALVRLAHHSELTVMRASGVSTARMALSLSRLGLALALVVFVVGEFLVPPAEQLATQVKLRATNAVVAQEFRSGLWLKDGSSFVNVREVLPDSTLMGVRIFEFDTAYKLRAISYAAEGKHLRDGDWRLLDVERTLFDGSRVRVNRLAEAHWRSTLDPDMLTVLLVKPQQMSAVNLWSYIRHLEDNGQATQRYRVALWSKLAYPLAAVVMLWLAIPFALFAPRAHSVGGKVFVGIMLGLAFHLANRVFANFSVLQDWSPAFAALFPTAFFLATAAAFIFWAERR